ncbi:GIY-YIG nuclease family protein [Brevibacillus porteri]|uniref:GIY-YIG nuclease family protein n=1 Tax=Brevibacillus porteri TaxID=2126350 RepID=UPI00370C5C59
MFINDPIDVWSYVYFIQEQNNGPIKIGIADNVNKRLKELQTGNSDELSILHWTTGGRALESFLHEKFSEIKKLGEWFWPDKELVHLIEEFKFEDDRFGRVLSIVQFADSEGMPLQRDEWETIVLLARGGVIQTEEQELKTRYWSILHSYRSYLERFPLKICLKRRMECRISSHNRPSSIS